WVIAAPGLALAALLLAAPSDPSPGGSAARPATTRGALAADFGRDAAAVLAVAAFRWTALGAAVMAFAAGGYAAWFVELLHLKGLAGADATTLFAAAGAGGLVGILVGGSLSDRLRVRRVDGRHLT